MKKIGLFLIALSLPLSAQYLIPLAAHAETFNSSMVIDDSTFDDANSMSAAQIDSFLNSFSSSCISPNSGFKAIDPTGYDPTNGFQYGGYVTAGQVIYDAAQAYGINPQVLITTLEKEQSLVTGENNFSGYCNNGYQHKYAAAVGYGCPDSGSSYSYNGLNLYQRNGVTVSSTGTTCVNTAAKAGFSQQIIRAAWLLKFGEQRSEGNINWAVVKGNWNNSDDPQSCYSGPMTQGTWQRCPSGATDPYDGYTTIDGTATHMDSGGTAALYWYTPHFSGNQNFVSIFSSWFGPTYDRNPLVRSNTTGKFYIRGDNGSLRYISSGAQLKDLGYGINWRISSFQPVDDSYIQAHDTSQTLLPLVEFGSGPEVYYYAYGGLHYVDYSTYQAYGSPSITVLDGYVKNYFWVGNNASTLLRDIGSTTPYAYSIESGPIKRYVADQDAWNYYGFGSNARSDAGPTILGSFADGLPYVKPDTIVSASDANQVDIISSAGNSEYPFSSTLSNSLTLPRISMPSSLLAKFSAANATPITLLAKDSSGNHYVLDQTQKVVLSASQLSNSGYVDTDFTTAPDELLSRLSATTSSADKLLFHIDGGANVYAGVGKQVLWFQTASDFNAFGYNFNQVLNLKGNTVSHTFTYNGVSPLPVGALIKSNTSSSIYLITQNGQKSYIPSAYLFSHLGFSFSNVRTVTQQSVDYLQSQPSILPYNIDGSGNVWLLQGGKKRIVPPSDVSAYALSGGANQINSWYVDNMQRDYPASKFIKIDNGQNVYYVDTGSTHLLSAAKYRQLGGTDWSDVTPVTSDLFYSLQQGSPWL